MFLQVRAYYVEICRSTFVTKPAREYINLGTCDPGTCSILRCGCLGGQTEAVSSFARTSRLLYKRSSLHRPAVKVICQSNEQQPTQTIYQGLKSVFSDFRLTYLSNYTESTIRGYSSHNNRSGQFTCLMPCSEHRLLTESPGRYFQIRDMRHGQTSQASYPFVVEWIAEKKQTWAQDYHGGRRYPIGEGKNTESPF